jgi:predicted negative regulator of RcsB-dependent stress response
LKVEFNNEEEQIEAIKEWLRNNGIPVLLGIVVVLAATFGWRAWKSHQLEVASQASTVYQQMLSGLQQSSSGSADVEAMKSVQAAADQLIKSWPDTAYADYAHLALAKQAVERAAYDQAADQLQQVVKNPATKALGYTASLRLARVYLQDNKLDEAKKIVMGFFPQAWQGESLELKGDILARQKDAKGARSAYEAAVSAYGSDRDAIIRLNMKLNQLQAVS